MEKIRIQNKDAVVIEVNDKGETIQFDFNDTSLPIKVMKMLADIEEQEKNFNAKLEELAKEKDNEEEIEYYGIKVTNGFIKYTELCNDFCNVCRGYIDELFGENASQKIFGTTNRPDMFTEFFSQVEPYLKKAGANMIKSKKELADRYRKDDNKGVM